MDANRGEISATFTPIPMLFLLSPRNRHTSMNGRTTKLEHNDIIISDQEKLQRTRR
jgi:hypothetical protein